MASAAQRTVPRYTRCSTHGAQRAAWRCTSCQRTLCPHCTALRRVPSGGTSIEVCTHCGGLAAPILVRRKVLGYVQALPDFLGSLMTMDGITTLVALGLMTYILRSIGLDVFGRAILIAYVLNIIDRAAHGSERLPEPTDFHGPGSLVMPVVRLAVAVAYIWVPGLLYLQLSGAWESLYFDGPSAIVDDPVVIILVVLGVLYFPVAVVVAGVSESVLAVLNLRLGVQVISRVPLQYLGAVLLSGLILMLGGLYALWARLLISLIPIPIIVPVACEVFGMVFWLTPAWVLGRFIYQNHEHFGVMLEGQNLEPEWPGAVPLGTASAEGSLAMRAMPSAEIEGWGHAAGLTKAADTLSQMPDNVRSIKPPSDAVVPIEIEGWSNRVVEGGADASIDLSSEKLHVLTSDLQDAEPPPSSPPPAAGRDLETIEDTFELAFEEDPVIAEPAPPPPTIAENSVEPLVSERPPPRPIVSPDDPAASTHAHLEAALQSEAGMPALAAYVRCQHAGVPIRLPAQLELRLAAVLDRAREFEAAVAACRRAADQDLQGPFAPQAIFMAAELYRERFHDVPRAVALYRYLVETYPTDALAPRAREALSRLA